MQRFNNIVLFGGETKNESMPVGFYSELALLPLRGKPVIWWQFENLKNQGLDDFILVVCKDNVKLIDYVKNILSENFNLKLVLISTKKNILSSLKYALKKADISLPTRVILGDTYIPESITSNTDMIYTSKNVTSSENWCLVQEQANGSLYFYDKQINISLSNKEAVVGYYTFSDTKYLFECCLKARLMLKKEISTALIMYQRKYKFATKQIRDWYDLGHTSGLIKVKNLLFSARDFNSISVDTKMGTLTKSSTKIQKLEDEAYWFNHIPDDLKILTPRFLNFEKDENAARLTQELYGYPSLQELYLSGNVNIEDWSYILEKLFDLHKLMENHTTNNDKNALKWLYWDKTMVRLQELTMQDEYWKKLLSKKTETVNGKKYLGVSALIPHIENYTKKLMKNGLQTVIHGDYCFSNILFDATNYTFKLIDPRGRLNADATIYGDPRYDIAKLRHSVVGLYDFIVQSLFKLSEKIYGFEYKILTANDYDSLEEIFDLLAEKNGYDSTEIKFIEGLLFLSMIPLHKDNSDRQKVFYLKAIELLNTVVEGNDTKWKIKNSEYALI